MYATHFGLCAEPFGLTPDPAFLYLSPDHREALAAVEYGLLDRRGFITMVGEVGTGKTTILYSLLGRLGPEIDTAFVGYTMQTFEEILATALGDFGVPVEDASKLALLTALRDHLLRRSAEGRTVALVIDEAQNLSDQAFEELRLLSNVETYTHKLLQIVLVGQPELVDRLRAHGLRQLRERVSVRATVNPLSATEMHRYIAHRVALVGGSATTLFTPGALRLIVRHAAGIPRRANILCHNALLFAYGRELSRVTWKVARQVIADARGRRPPVWRRMSLPQMGDAGWAAGLAVVIALTTAGGAKLVTSWRAADTRPAAVTMPSAPAMHSASAVSTVARIVPAVQSADASERPITTISDAGRGLVEDRAAIPPALARTSDTVADESTCEADAASFGSGHLAAAGRPEIVASAPKPASFDPSPDRSAPVAPAPRQDAITQPSPRQPTTSRAAKAPSPRPSGTQPRVAARARSGSVGPRKRSGSTVSVPEHPGADRRAVAHNDAHDDSRRGILDWMTDLFGRSARQGR